LANHFYFIAHVDSTGKLRLNPRVAGLGLGAALLAELMVQRRVAVQNGDIVVTNPHPTEDLLQHQVLDRILSEPKRHPIRDWLSYLGTSAIDDVAQRLTRAGALEVYEAKKLFGGVERRYTPVSMNDAAWPAVRLARALAMGGELDLADQALAGIIKATALDRHVLKDDAGGRASRYLASIIAGLPEPLRLLVVETEITVGRAVLSQRT